MVGAGACAARRDGSACRERRGDDGNGEAGSSERRAGRRHETSHLTTLAADRRWYDPRLGGRMSESASEAATLSGPPVRPDLVAHVRDSVDALETLGDAPGSAARATELLRATRETVAALKDARAS